MVQRQSSYIFVLVTLCGILCCKCDAFRNPSSTLTKARPGTFSPIKENRNFIKLPRRNVREGLQMTTLQNLVRPRQWLPVFGSTSGWVFRGAALLITLLLSSIIYRRRVELFWPNVKADANFHESLPPGSLGCPLLGANNLVGSKRLGPEYFYRKASENLGNPRVWMSYFLGSPYVVVSGSSLVAEVNNMEFSQTASLSSASSIPSSNDSTKEKLTKKKKKPVVFGRNNLMFERNREKHIFLRKLVGSAMTSQALKSSIPIMQQIAEDVIEREIVWPLTMSDSRENQVKMEDICVDYTMDIVQRQFLGLKLPSKEVDIFREKLKIWTKAFFSILGQLRIPWLVARSAPYKAKVYIESKLEAKIDSLLIEGPDESIVSNMLFARDEDLGSTKLSREEVVENALLLVLAGAETSAGSLTLAMLLLGLHEEKYSRLVQEQKQIVEKHGEELTTTILDKECPYLDAIVKETLRIGPITGGFPRIAKETLVVDGVQIPKGWPIFTTVRLTHQLDSVTRQKNDAHMDVYDGFRPERWLQPETTPSEYIPFGAGPRYCIGYHLAMAEMKIFLALLARRIAAFELQNYACGTKKPVLWNPGTIMPRPLDGVPIKSIDITQRESTAPKYE